MPKPSIMQCSPISKLVDDLMQEIFFLCLPSYEEAETRFHSSFFITPSSSQAPLLLCQVSFAWRALAIGTPWLWNSLNTESILYSELVQLWLQRAADSTLSLRIAKPIARFPDYYTPIPPPALLVAEDYRFPMHLHLPLLLPKLSHCRRLEITDWCPPPLFQPEHVSPLALESISVIVGYSNHRAAHWFSKLMSQAPRLTELHWIGPSISAPWAQLTHLSWEPRDADEFEEVLDQLGALTHFRIDASGFQFGSPRAVHILPQVTTFFFSGRGPTLPFFTLPRLQCLILESEPVGENAKFLKDILDRSQCRITFLEIDDHSLDNPSSLLDDILSLFSHESIASSLTHLVVSSCDLDMLFLALDRASPGLLPHTLLLLRAVDRCFRIDVFPSSPPGVLGALIRAQFPVLDKLDLDVTRCTMHQLESRTVVTGSTKFLVGRPTALRIEYEAWWSSRNGQGFRKTLETGSHSAKAPFEVRWDDVAEWWASSRPRHNIFSNSSE
ncbi:hypothetical protein C8R44DRAFT_871539 [Mycena epipterygia]|nr:hypothetical protein C8R44DRAFT_871539 [Mycena epipterygia]